MPEFNEGDMVIVEEGTWHTTNSTHVPDVDPGTRVKLVQRYVETSVHDGAGTTLPYWRTTLRATGRYVLERDLRPDYVPVTDAELAEVHRLLGVPGA